MIPRFKAKQVRKNPVLLADRARDAREWALASWHYREALDQKPDNPHIWVQYGHALKESGHVYEAEAAYRSSLKLEPRIADTHLQLGHALKIQGKKDEAVASYLRALTLDPTLHHASVELLGLGWSKCGIQRALRYLNMINDEDASDPSHSVAAVRSAGLPSPIRAPLCTDPRPRPVADIPGRERVENCLALIATRNYLPFAKLTAQSFLLHHDDFAVFLLLLDGETSDTALFPEGRVILLSDLGLEQAGWYAAKFNAVEFANSLKPVWLRFLSRFVDKAIYLDSDIAVFSRLTEMIDALKTKDLVLIPHALAPLPRPEQLSVHPNNSDIFNSGLINAGCFGIRLGRCDRFLQFWQDANMAIGAFYAAAGYQTDQQYLNWALVTVPELCVLREARYNVAYWNLHDRNLRLANTDDHQEPAFHVDGKPLGFFHFSGYNVNDKLTLSRHDGRYSVYHMPAVAEILNWYSDRILSCPRANLLAEPYGFDYLPNGFYMTQFVRELLKKYEAYASRFDVRTAEGSDQLCAWLMDPLPATGSMLPLVAAEVYEARPDLQKDFPGAHTAYYPSGFWRWFCRHAGKEYHVQILIDQFRRSLISDSIVGFAEAVVALLGDDQEIQFLGSDRMFAAEQLQKVGRKDIAETLLEARTEWWFFTELGAIFKIYESRADLQNAFPDIMDRDHIAFVNWLSDHASREHGLSSTAVESFAPRTSGVCLARIFSYLARREDLWQSCQNSLLSEDPEPIFRHLIRGAGEGLECDLGDVEVLRFLHGKSRCLLVPLYLELPFVRQRPNASRMPAISLSLLPKEVQSTDWAQFGCELHAAYFDKFETLVEDEVLRRSAEISSPQRNVFGFLRTHHSRQSVIEAAETTYRAAGSLPSKLATTASLSERLRARECEPGVNIFGHFYADTGVGESTRGLACAVSALRPVNPIPLYTSHLQDGTELSQLFQRFDYTSDTNVFVSYPHQGEDLFGVMRQEYFRGRFNIAHLAWEQNDLNRWWKPVYDRYDEIWTISEFAAIPFRKMFPGRVRVVPNVLCFEQYPSCDEENRARLTGEHLDFLFVFDANSSIERKNPEAVISAFRKAFEGTRHAKRARLTLKIGSLHRVEHAQRVERLMSGAQSSSLKIDFDGRRLGRRALMQRMAEADCYVSLHRSEGFGYTMAEAMFYGIPVIASGYSGNLDYMTTANSFLVPCKESFVKTADGPFQRGSVWGEPDTDIAADLMRLVAEKPSDALVIGANGRRTVFEQLSAAKVAERIKDCFAGRKELVSDILMAAK